MIRYNISRPVHDSKDPLRPPCDPLPKIWRSRPSAPRIDAPAGYQWERSLFQEERLPRGGLRRMKMPQEKNGENTDLKCDLVLRRNKDYEKGGHHKMEAFEMKVWRRMEEISWTEHISNEVLKLIEEERSLLTIIITRQRPELDGT